jgi:hypothetical protein
METGLNFSDLAYAKFLQTAPELSNLILTFQDVSEELADNTDIKIGLFILRAGEDLLFVPVISKGEGIYPIDSIFVNSKGKFFPLTKNTVDTVLSQQKSTLGKPKKIPDTVSVNPSVYDMVNPPRTGKFVYASESRFTEFLAALPNGIKETVLEKFASDPEVSNKLHKIFGIENLVRALRATSYEPASRPQDHAVGARVITTGENLPTPMAISILTQGYAIDGANPLTRVALATEDWKDGRFTNLSKLDGGYDYDVVMKDGTIRRAFAPLAKVPAFSDTRPVRKGTENESHFLLFENGDFAINTGAVVIGERSGDRNVVSGLFKSRPPVMLKDVTVDDVVGIFDENMLLIGVYEVRSVTRTYSGTEVKAYDRTTHDYVTVHALRGYIKSPVNSGKDIYVPSQSVVVILGSNIGSDMEEGVQAAANKREMLEWAMLNTTMNISHDGIEFFVNGMPMGKEASVMSLLVEKEGIDPSAAESFVKKAKENSRVTVYLSKKADFGPGEIPQFGNQPPKQNMNFGPGAQRDSLPMNNLKDGMATGDQQTIEAVVISELLQSPDLYEHVAEYIPDIEEAIDRLGRILFLGRIHVNKLGEGNSADEVFSFLALLRNVYRMLGDSYIKLQRLVGNAPKDDGSPQN